MSTDRKARPSAVCGHLTHNGGRCSPESAKFCLASDLDTLTPVANHWKCCQGTALPAKCCPQIRPSVAATTVRGCHCVCFLESSHCCVRCDIGFLEVGLGVFYAIPDGDCSRSEEPPCAMKGRERGQ